MQWRVGEICAPGLAGWRDSQPRRYEIEPHWTSEELSKPALDLRLPADVCKTGHTYRVRARYKDTTARWSRWSEAVQFVAGK